MGLAMPSAAGSFQPSPTSCRNSLYACGRRVLQARSKAIMSASETVDPQVDILLSDFSLNALDYARVFFRLVDGHKNSSI